MNVNLENLAETLAEERNLGKAEGLRVAAAKLESGGATPESLRAVADEIDPKGRGMYECDEKPTEPAS